ncbi:MAG: GAF domain-containing protein [Anaerolineae bacterium]|nr:GAF domain-containing protein [Anaerolineae bacterium]MDH7474023.1 GAF domain-containing protein [Anaerolineae bacterium]
MALRKYSHPVMKYKDLAESSSDAMCLLDAEGRLLAINQRARELLNRHLDLNGRVFSELFDPMQATRIRRELARVLESESVPPINASWVGEDGQPIPVELTMVNLQDKGRSIGVLVIIHDGSERQRLELELAQTQKELQRRIDEARITYAIGAAIALNLKLEEILWLIYAQTGSVLNFSTFSLALYNEEQDQLQYDLFVDGGKRAARFSQKIGDEELEPASWVVRTRRSLLIYDWEVEQDNWPKADTRTIGENMRSWLAVPLVAQERVIGVMSIQSQQPNAYDEGHQRLLYAIADHAAVAIENALLHAQTQQELEERAALNELARTISSTLDLDMVLDAVMSETIRTTGAERGCLLLRDPASGTLVFRAARNLDERIIDSESFEISRTVVERVATEGVPVLTVNAKEDPRFGQRTSVIAYGLRSILAVPLIAKGEIIGAIYVDNRLKVGQFTQRHLEWLTNIATQAAMAIRNAQLFEAERKRAIQLETIREVSQRIVSILVPDELLAQVVALIRERFGYYHVHIFLVDSEAGYAELRAGTSTQEQACRQSEPRISLHGKGIISWVASHGQPLLINDVGRVPSFQFDYLLADAKAELAVPLRIGERITGVLDVQSDRVNAFDKSDLFVLQALSDQVAVALENARLFDEIQRRLDEVSTLYTVAQQTTTSLDLNEVLENIVCIIKQVLDCRGCCIFLVDEEKQELSIRAASGLSEKWRDEARLKVGEGISGQVAATGQSIYIPDARSHPGFIFFDPAVRSLLVVPMITKDRVIGTLSIDDTRVDAFTGNDERLLSIAAAQAAVAIENAQLYEDLKERAEKLERAYNELKELDRLKSEFVQNVSHELRTPLTFVKAYVELMLDGTLGELNERQRESLKIVAERTNTLTRLVRDIIALQQIEQGTLHLSMVNLGEIAQMSMKGAELTARQAGIELKAEISAELPLISGDRDRLNQVFDNILGNAIKFSPDGGEVIIRVWDAGDVVQASISDTGIGIPESELEKIFERFYQVDGSTTRRFGGTGLGLAIVKRIVEAHGGRVWAESTLGRGSTFFFALPKPATSNQQRVTSNEQ